MTLFFLSYLTVHVYIQGRLSIIESQTAVLTNSILSARNSFLFSSNDGNGVDTQYGYVAISTSRGVHRMLDWRGLLTRHPVNVMTSLVVIVFDVLSSSSLKFYITSVTSSKVFPVAECGNHSLWPLGGLVPLAPLNTPLSTAKTKCIIQTSAAAIQQ